MLDLSSEKGENSTMDEEKNPQVLFHWNAPIRPYKKRGVVVLRFYIALTLLLSSIVFFFGDKVLLLPIWALMFLFYILTITPPPTVDNKITKFGIQTADTTLRWEFLSHFYFSRRFGISVLTLVSHPPYNYHSYLVLPDDGLKQKLIPLLTEHLIYVEHPKKGFTERAIDALSSLIPDDGEKTEAVKDAEETKREESHAPQTADPTP